MAPAISSAASAAATAAAGTKAGANDPSRKTIAQNFDAFLLLLTTQLKNQNPLEPLDSNQFTQQLVQFSSVEQQVKTNDSLTAILAGQKTAAVTSALGFVGTKVRADGSTTTLKGGSAEWRVNAPRAAASASFTIKDSNGNAVYTQTKSLDAGDQAFAWNGRNSTGGLASEGDYTLQVTAQDASGQALAVKLETSGIVDAVDVSGDTPILRIGNTLLPAYKVKSIERIG